MALRKCARAHGKRGEREDVRMPIQHIMSRTQQGVRTAGRFVRRFGIRRGVAAYAHISMSKRLRDVGAVIALDIPHSPLPFRIRPADADAHAFWQVFIEGEYDLPVPFAPAVIVDAGAHIGCAAVYFAHRFPEARIVAIEPAPANAALLRANVAAIARISVVEGALWSGPGELSIANPGAQSWSFRVTQPNVGEPTVPTVTIPALLERLGAIDILKLDIEGAEGELFHGDTTWLAHTRMVILELHERYAPGCTELVHSVMQARSFDQVSGRGENVVFVNRAWAGRA
jgi:FkbM family methyltransferase